jgi:EAL domain-containing protein (putative c-di-GMP-specific phosphodiesterase class I)
LDEFNLDPHLLEIELTESSLVDTHDQSFAVLERINEMGIRVTMDDFGTGYSSLSYLRNIPLSCLKIDRSFISDINKDENADKLIASILSMAHGLGLDVVAEGVEEKHQADHLTALGCEYLQGYYFSRPIPHSEVEDILQKQPMALTG